MQIWRSIKSYLFCPTTIVAVVGPDGVGKSSALSAAEAQLRSEGVVVRRRHWRPSLLPPLGRIRNHNKPSEAHSGRSPRRDSGRGQIVRVLYYWLDYQIGHWVRDRRAVNDPPEVILYDRCALDVAVDPGRYGMKPGRFLPMLWNLTPGPDLIILLKDDPAKIFSRKPELAVEEITRQLSRWEEFVSDGRVRVVVSASYGAESTAQDLVEQIRRAVRRTSQGRPR